MTYTEPLRWHVRDSSRTRLLEGIFNPAREFCALPSGVCFVANRRQTLTEKWNSMIALLLSALWIMHRLMCHVLSAQSNCSSIDKSMNEWRFISEWSCVASPHWQRASTYDTIKMNVVQSWWPGRTGPPQISFTWLLSLDLLTGFFLLLFCLNADSIVWGFTNSPLLPSILRLVDRCERALRLLFRNFDVVFFPVVAFFFRRRQITHIFCLWFRWREKREQQKKLRELNCAVNRTIDAARLWSWRTDIVDV